MTEFLMTTFWLGLAVLVYVYGGFSVLLALAAKIVNRRVVQKEITPRVSVIIAAYNEQQNIAEKLENVLSLDYPSEMLEVIVASDGSDDQTATIVAGFERRRVQLLDLPRQGKIFAIDAAVKRASGEILVFSDANTIFLPQALRMLVRNFADPSVGGVCGNQKHLPPDKSDNSSEGEHLYWAYDKWLKTRESLTGSIVSADGAIYAIRTRLYEMPARTDVTDDFAISTGVIEKGYRLVFENDALAHEKASVKAADEFNRKVRIMNRGLRSVLLRKKLLNPFKYGFYSIVLFTHKVLRRMVPFVLLWLLLANFILAAQSSFFVALAMLQVLFYALAMFGYLFRDTRLGKLKIFYIPFFYCLANCAALIAITRLLRGKRIELWQPHRETLEGTLVESEML